MAVVRFLNSASFETRRFDTLDLKEAKVLLDALAA